MAPEEAATNGTYYNYAVDWDYDSARREIQKVKQGINTSSMSTSSMDIAITIFEAIDINETGSQISKTWYSYNPPHVRNLSKDSPVLHGVRQTIFRRRFMSDINLINNGFSPSIVSRYNYQKTGITKNPFKMAMSGESSRENLRELVSVSPSSVDAAQHIKKAIDRGNISWGFENTSELAEWLGQGKLPENMN
jgi:hypothetical protein